MLQPQADLYIYIYIYIIRNIIILFFKYYFMDNEQWENM